MLVGTTATPAAGAPAPFLLTMDDGGGSLRIRGAEDSYPLESPTTFAGTIDGGDQGTGAITGGTFTTPAISFQVAVLNGALMADVDAHFEEVAAGTSTGSVSPDGEVVLRTSLRADLRIVVAAAGVDANCTTSPVDLELLSTAPYDDGTQRVTLSDPNFSIPSFPTTAACPSLVTDNLNPQLAGPGHSLELTFTGAIDLPPPPGAHSTTTLTASPEGAARFGEDVTLRAEIASDDPETTAVATGIVRFSADGDLLGTVTLTEGVAELTTSVLNAGSHTLTATYSGDSEYQPSTDEIPYTVDAVPAFDIDLPHTVAIDEAPQEFTMTVENPTLGSDITNAAVDITFTRPAGGFLRPGMFVLERRVSGDTWEEVPMTQGSNIAVVVGRIGPVVGRPLPAPGILADALRISANPQATDGTATSLGAVTVRADVNQVNPGTGAVVVPLTTTEGGFDIVGPERLPTSLVFDDTVTGPGISPTVVRAGNSFTVNGWRVDSGGAGGNTGTVSVRIDGQPVMFWYPDLALTAEPVSTAPVNLAGFIPPLTINSPETISAGPHTITVNFSGSTLFEPSTRSEIFTVVAQRGAVFDCFFESASSNRFRAQVRGFGRLPSSVAARGTVDVRGLDVDLVIDRSISTGFSMLTFLNVGPNPVGAPNGSGNTIEVAELGFGDSAGTATSVSRTGEFQIDPSDTDPDMSLTFDGEAASVTVMGTPGQVVPINLDRVVLRQRNFAGSISTLTCIPVGDPVNIGNVTVAGTTLAVEASQPVRDGDRVRLRAEVAPSYAAGQVEFVDGDEVVAIAPVVAGQAVATTTLSVGSHEVTARFRGGLSAPSTVSAPVTVVVLSAVECPGFADPGNGAVVRLVYLELLGRCPDAVGYAFWTGRLDGGTTPEAFARSIASTPEAVGRVVDDAYRTMLGRPADGAGRTFWTGRLLGHGRYDQLLADLGASAEFWSLAGSSDVGFVTRVYDRLLGRVPDAVGLEYWTGRLAGGTSPRVLVLTLANLDEPLGVLVKDSYGEILDRVPDAGERSDGIVFLRATGDRSGLYAQLIGTGEFDDRAQTFPNPD